MFRARETVNDHLRKNIVFKRLTFQISYFVGKMVKDLHSKTNVLTTSQELRVLEMHVFLLMINEAILKVQDKCCSDLNKNLPHRLQVFEHLGQCGGTV